MQIGLPVADGMAVSKSSQTLRPGMFGRHMGLIDVISISYCYYHSLKRQIVCQ